MVIPVKSISELEEKSEVSVSDKILILDSVSEEARLASKSELKGDPWEPWTPWKDWEDWADWADWQPWYTPIKWVDYFTQEDIASLNIPTKVSDLTNDKNFSSMEEVTEDEWGNIEDRMINNVNYFIYE